MAGAKRKGATAKKTAAKKKVAAKKVVAGKEAAVKKAIGKAIGKKTAPKKAAPKKAAPKKAAPKKAAPKKAAPKKAAPKKAAPKKAAPKKAAATKPTAKKKRPSLGVTRRRDAFRPIDDEAPTVEIATPHTERSPRSRPDAFEPTPTSASVPTIRPSERVLASVAEMPNERALTAEESEAMTKVAETARKVIAAAGDPSAVVLAIASFLEDVRLGKRDEPKSQDVRLGLGVLWGDQLKAQVGWTWVHLTYPDGFASYALVPDDRAFACFPLNRVPDALRGNGTSTSAHVFESIREGALPTRRERSYLVIG